jgi:hypothetical protein
VDDEWRSEEEPIHEDPRRNIHGISFDEVFVKSSSSSSINKMKDPLASSKEQSSIHAKQVYNEFISIPSTLTKELAVKQSLETIQKSMQSDKADKSRVELDKAVKETAVCMETVQELKRLADLLREISLNLVKK